MTTGWRGVLRLNCLEVRINWWLWEPPSVLSAPWIWCNQDRTWSKKKERKKKGFTTLSSLSFPHLSFINTHNQTSDTLRYNPIKYVEWTPSFFVVNRRTNSSLKHLEQAGKTHIEFQFISCAIKQDHLACVMLKKALKYRKPQFNVVLWWLSHAVNAQLQGDTQAQLVHSHTTQPGESG